jgi:hypothetical protein
LLKKLKGLFRAHTGSVASVPLYFKNNVAAFDYACQYLSLDLESEAILPALVIDAATALGADQSVILMEDGTQMLALRVCSRDGGFLVLARSITAKGPRLRLGDLVAWQAGAPLKREMPELNKDPRSHWAGAVLMKLKPQYVSDKGWAIDEPFRPD